jgi:hypothetical protein
VRTVITILLIFSGLSQVFGQSAEDEVIRLKQQEGIASGMETETITESPPVKIQPLSWNMNLGTGYSYMPGYGSGMFAYTAPALTVPVNSRWSLHGGVMVSYFMPVGLGSPAQGELGNQGSFSSFSVFGAASYRMNDRLVLHGAGVKQLATTPLPMPVTPFSPYPTDRISLGATYRLGNNVSIGASIHMQKDNGYYYASPFYW